MGMLTSSHQPPVHTIYNATNWPNYYNVTWRCTAAWWCNCMFVCSASAFQLISDRVLARQMQVAKACASPTRNTPATFIVGALSSYVYLASHTACRWVTVSVASMTMSVDRNATRYAARKALEEAIKGVPCKLPLDHPATMFYI